MVKKSGQYPDFLLGDNLFERLLPKWDNLDRKINTYPKGGERHENSSYDSLFTLDYRRAKLGISGFPL
jgi:uncharacterized protein YdcH (DUF465 family)